MVRGARVTYRLFRAAWVSRRRVSDPYWREFMNKGRERAGGVGPGLLDGVVAAGVEVSGMGVGLLGSGVGRLVAGTAGDGIGVSHYRARVRRRRREPASSLERAAASGRIETGWTRRGRSRCWGSSWFHSVGVGAVRAAERGGDVLGAVLRVPGDVFSGGGACGASPGGRCSGIC